MVGFLAGPTASGKSSIAVGIAQQNNFAIISADSMQVYRGMQIGTGAIPENERGGVPHHLLGVADPGEDFHAARFVEAARAAAKAEWENHGRRSLLVGGTGMWIQSLREGLLASPGRNEAIRQRLRERLAAEGPEVLHTELRALDPPMAEKLSPRDHVRVIRALEVLELSGKPLSVWHEEDRQRRAALGPLLPLVVIERPMTELRERIGRRVDQMMADGWLEEARRLHALKLPDHAPAKKALGYRTLFEVIEGRTSLDEAVARIKLATGQYAKQQMTWFRAQRDVAWTEGGNAVEASLMLELQSEH